MSNYPFHASRFAAYLPSHEATRQSVRMAAKDICYAYNRNPKKMYLYPLICAAVMLYANSLDTPTPSLTSKIVTGTAGAVFGLAIAFVLNYTAPPRFSFDGAMQEIRKSSSTAHTVAGVKAQKLTREQALQILMQPYDARKLPASVWNEQLPEQPQARRGWFSFRLPKLLRTAARP